LASGNDIPAGVRIVQIAPELDEAFMSVGDVLVDSRSRIWACEHIERQSHKHARVISQGGLRRASAAEEQHLDFVDRRPSYCC
jgi:hypothetical protein